MEFFKRNWLAITVVLGIQVVFALGFFAGAGLPPAAPTTEIPAESAVEPAPTDSSVPAPAPDTTATAATPAVATPTVTAAPAAEDQVRDIAHFAEAAAASAVTVRKAVTDLSQRVTALEEKSASTPAPVAPTATAPVAPAAPEERYEEARIRAKWRGYPQSAGVSYFNLRREGRTFNVRADDPENFRAWLAREEAEFQAWLKGTKP